MLESRPISYRRQYETTCTYLQSASTQQRQRFNLCQYKRSDKLSSFNDDVNVSTKSHCISQTPHQVTPVLRHSCVLRLSVRMKMPPWLKILSTGAELAGTTQYMEITSHRVSWLRQALRYCLFTPEVETYKIK